MNWLKRLFTLPKDSNSLDDIIKKYADKPFIAVGELINNLPYSIRLILYQEIMRLFNTKKDEFDRRLREYLAIGLTKVDD